MGGELESVSFSPVRLFQELAPDLAPNIDKKKRTPGERGNNQCVEGLKIQIEWCCAITQLDLMSALVNMRCRPFGNFPRLPFGRSINNQDVHQIPPMSPRPSSSADAFPKLDFLI
jgi:hypothetical protein